VARLLVHGPAKIKPGIGKHYLGARDWNVKKVQLNLQTCRGLRVGAAPRTVEREVVHEYRPLSDLNRTANCKLRSGHGAG